MAVVFSEGTCGGGSGVKFVTVLLSKSSTARFLKIIGILALLNNKIYSNNDQLYQY